MNIPTQRGAVVTERLRYPPDGKGRAPPGGTGNEGGVRVNHLGIKQKGGEIMRNRLRAAATVGAVAMLLWPAVRANAACTNFADSTQPDCKAATKCQAAILKDVSTYVTAMQKVVQGMVNNSLTGKSSTIQKFACIGGPNNGKACLGNNGGCTAGKKNAACNTNADCDLAVGTGVCNFGPPNGCNSATNVAPVTLDAAECQPDQTKGPVSKDAVKASAALSKDILKMCATSTPPVDPATLGLDRIESCLIGECTGGTNAGTPCNTANPGGQCKGGGACDVNSSLPKAYGRIVDCIKNSADGDVAGGKTVDTVIRLLAKVTGTGALAPQSKTGPSDLLPRQILQLTGSNILQIGSGVQGNSGTNSSAGGSVVQLSLAKCSSNPGNGLPACINNKDCADSASGGTCSRNTAGPGVNTLNGSQAVHKCCDGGTNLGKSCAVNGDCPSAACSINAACAANILTVTETKSNGLTTCLVTRTKNAGNGTGANGTLNLTTGSYLSTSPIATDVNLITCPRCSGGVCDSGASVGVACTAPEGSISSQCLPSTTPLATVPNPLTFTTGGVALSANFTGVGGTCGFCEDTGSPANGFCDTPPCDSCGTSTGSPGTCPAGKTCDTISGTPKAFCGFCDSVNNQSGACDHGGETTPGSAAGDPVCAVGCTGNDQTGANADCVAKLGAGHFCDFGKSAPGFHGDCSLTHLGGKGEANQYTPSTVGLFCTGRTGACAGPICVDGIAGLPGPVLLDQPYVWQYVYSTDK